MVVAHGGMIAGLVCGLLGLPTSTWPSIGGMAQLPLGRARAPRRPSPLAAVGLQRGRLGGPAHRPLTRRCRAPRCWSSPTRSPSTGPSAPSPPTIPRLWPNVAAAALGGRAELVAGIGWTARHAWQALIRDPRIWAVLPAGRRARARRRRHGHAAVAAADGAARAAPGRAAGRAAPGASGRATGACSPRWRGRSPGRCPAAGPVALPPHLTVRHLEQCRAAVLAIRPGIPVVAVLPPVHRAAEYAHVHAGRPAAERATRAWARRARRRAPRPQGARRGARAERPRQPGRHALGLVGARRRRPGLRRAAPAPSRADRLTRARRRRDRLHVLPARRRRGAAGHPGGAAVGAAGRARGAGGRRHRHGAAVRRAGRPAARRPDVAARARRVRGLLPGRAGRGRVGGRLGAPVAGAVGHVGGGPAGGRRGRRRPGAGGRLARGLHGARLRGARRGRRRRRRRWRSTRSRPRRRTSQGAAACSSRSTRWNGCAGAGASARPRPGWARRSR